MGVIVKINPPYDNVVLPDGITYRTNKQVTLSDAQYAVMPAASARAISVVQSGVPDPTPTDNGSTFVLAHDANGVYYAVPSGVGD